MKKRFFLKLAAENIKKNGKTYIPYMLTCILTVAMFYIVKSLSLNPGLENMLGGNFLHTTMGLGSGVVSVFAFIFLFYTNSFLIKRRKRELGLYSVLGLEKKHIGIMMLWESLFLYCIVMVGAIALGLLFSRLIFLLLLWRVVA